MKSLVKMTLISSAILFTLTGCDNEADIQTDAQKNSYAIGSSYATDIQSIMKLDGVDLDRDSIIKGFTETLKEKAQYNPGEVQDILDNFGANIQKEAQARLETEKAESTVVGDKFRTEFAQQPGVQKTDSGLLYQIIQPGTGAHPTIDDTIDVNYSGALVDGRVFDSSYARNEPATIPLNLVIPGWAEGIQLIGVGGKIKLVIPPELGYADSPPTGQVNSVRIPSSATLVFEVELLAISNDNSEN